MSKRGNLTSSIKEKANEFLNREIDVKELRLYPYLDFCVKNFNKIDLSKVSKDERVILDKLMEEKHIVYSSEKIICTRAFYYYMQGILEMSYVEEFL